MRCPWLFSSFSLFLTATVLLSCAEDRSGTNFDRIQRNQMPDSVAALSWFPEKDSLDVDTLEVIRLKFSGSIDTNNFEDWMIRISTPDGGIQYATKKMWNSDNTEVQIYRFIGGQQVPWDLYTEHQLTAEFLLDTNGNPVWPFTLGFTTRGASTATGSFVIRDEDGVLPKEPVIDKDDWIELNFSEAVTPSSHFDQAFEFVVTKFLNQSGTNSSVGPMTGEVDFELICNAQNLCDKLRFRRRSGWEQPFQYPNMITIRVKSHASLRGRISNQPLPEGATIIKWLFPF